MHITNPLKSVASIIRHLAQSWRYRHFFVILDPNDSSVTLSRELFRHIKKSAPDPDIQPRAFMFSELNSGIYGFAINPSFDQPVQMADIQYNSRHRCIGFETLNPTVAKIFFDYKINCYDAPCKLSVTVQSTPNLTYYQIRPPHEKPYRSR